MSTKKQQNKRVHLMLEDGPWSLCGRYLCNFPGMLQTFDPMQVTCGRCKDTIRKQLARVLSDKALSYLKEYNNAQGKNDENKQ